MSNEYPAVYVDDLGFHYTIKFDIIEDIIKRSMFDAKGDVVKIRRYKYGYLNGTEYLFHDDNQEWTSLASMPWKRPSRSCRSAASSSS